MTDTLYLNEDVFFCLTEGQGIFLDLKRDMYSAVPISGEPAHEFCQKGVSGVAALLAAQREALEEEELVTRDGVTGSPIEAFLAIERPRAHAFYPDDQRAFGLAGEAAKGMQITLADALDFFLASRRASRSLRTRHIRDVVHAVRLRKAGEGDLPIELEAFRRETAIFRRLRPWYPRGYRCLFDSLALIEFLARRRLYPLWIFAVQAQPFGAHCWVQAGGYLLNEGSEYAGQFTPIMAIQPRVESKK